MDKCHDCNALMTKQETVCVQCGAAVKPREEKPGLAAHFSTVIKVTMITSAALTAASLFFSFTPPFSKCIVATLVLGIVKSSADQMLEKNKS